MTSFNVYRILFVVLLITLTAVKILLSILNLRHMRKCSGSVPEEFREKVKDKDMERILDYNSARTKVGNIQSAVFTGVLILIIFGNVLGPIISKSERFSGCILQGLAFFFTIGAIFWIVSIPFDIFETFHIEKLFGFNRQTFSSWLKDLFKSLLIAIIIGGILLSLLLAIVEKSGRFWWLYSWGLVLVFGIAITLLYPVVIAPLFNKFTPLDKGDLLEKVKAIGQKSGIKVRGIFKMDAGKRSSHTNAYFTGFGRSKRIVLFDTLLESMDDDEIASVVAHEAGHWKRKHILKSLSINAVYSFAWFLAAGLLLGNDSFYKIFFVPEKFVPAGLFLMAVIWQPLNFFINPLLLAYSRKNEREADDAVAELTSQTGPFKRALVKLSTGNLSALNPHPAYVIFNYSHPPVTERIKRLS